MIGFNSKIYVAGHKGLVGSSILRKLKANGYKNIIYADSKKSDLSNFKYQANYYVLDPAASSSEYFLIPGFEFKKKHLKELMDKELLIASEKLKLEKQLFKKKGLK